MSPADARPPGAPIGTVARLQVQHAPLKPGPRGARVYDPSPLVEVAWLEVGPRGVRGPDGLLDAHHADHPLSRNVRLTNGLSVLPRTHADAVRDRFGEHAVVGCAGENVLLETPAPLTSADLTGVLLLDTVQADGRPGEPLELTGATAAAPCVEFTRWLLGRGPGTPVDDDVRAAMAFLGEGRRGFYLTARGSGRVVRGARLRRA